MADKFSGDNVIARTPQARKVKARALRASTLPTPDLRYPPFYRFRCDLIGAQIQKAIRTVKSFRPPEPK